MDITSFYSADITSIESHVLTVILIVVVLVALVAIRRPKWIKVSVGEFCINARLYMSFDPRIHPVNKDVILPTEEGSAKIDFVIISVHGVFVIKTIDINGRIFGGKDQDVWKQKTLLHENILANPLYENEKHVKLFRNILGLNENQIFSVVSFIGDSRFKTEMPENVTNGKGCIKFIRSKKELVITAREKENLINEIETWKLIPYLEKNHDYMKQIRAAISQK